MKQRRRRVNYRINYRINYRVGMMLASLLMSPVSQGQTFHQAEPFHRAQLSWPAFEQYQAQGQLLQFSAAGLAKGHLLIWPEFNQTHLWLPVAHYWQQQNWQVSVLLPDTAQHQFDPSSEQPSTAQQAWQKQQLHRLNQVIQTESAAKNGADIDANVAASSVVNSAANGNKDPNAGEFSLAASPNSKPLLVLVQGSAALWYQQWLDAEQLRVPQALVLFDALPQTQAQQSMLAISLARSPYPILDIYSQPESPLAWHNQQRRQQQLQRREKTGYAQLRIKEPSLVNKPIAGWLVRLGWLPLPPSAPKYLQEQHSESGISRSRNATTTGPAAPP